MPAGKAFGTRAARNRVVREILRAARTMERPTFIVSHSDAPDLAAAYRTELLLKSVDATVWVTDTAPAIGSHAGPHAAAIAVTDANVIDRAVDARSE